MDNPNEWGFPITDNVTGKVCSCASNQLMKDLCYSINEIVKENNQLKQELIEFKKWETYVGDVKREDLDKDSTVKKILTVQNEHL